MPDVQRGKSKAARELLASDPRGYSNNEAQGVPLQPGNGRWMTSDGPDRISPRECVKAAQDDMNKAWGTQDYFAAVGHVRGAVDWLRRALEQMAPKEPCEGCGGFGVVGTLGVELPCPDCRGKQP